MATIGRRRIDMAQAEHYKGASNELLAAAWFTRQGYQVYLPVVQQGAVDFIVDLEYRLLKVQVKSATWVESSARKDGVKLKYLQCRTQSERLEVIPYDALFIVYDENYWLIPASILVSSNLSLKRGVRDTVPNKWESYIVYPLDNIDTKKWQ